MVLRIIGLAIISLMLSHSCDLRYSALTRFGQNKHFGRSYMTLNDVIYAVSFAQKHGKRIRVHDVPIKRQLTLIILVFVLATVRAVYMF